MVECSCLLYTSIQGVNGVDVWYGNLENTNLKLYDYIETNTILGTAKEDYYYLAFVKDGNFIKMCIRDRRYNRLYNNL